MKKENRLTTLYTKTGENFNINAWNVYPRPLMRRDSFLCLNGEWDFALCESLDENPNFTRKIMVPFCPQSALSGINELIDDRFYLYYKKDFSLPEGFKKDKVLLHFGAVDQIAHVYINGKKVGSHEGGYTPFSFDITDFLEENNTILVIAKDELDSKIQPYGKQKHARGGMWYTPVSGIWQTVWLESVPQNYIQSIDIHSDKDLAVIRITGAKNGVLTLKATDGEKTFEIINGETVVKLENRLLWTPEEPNLYEFSITADEDKIDSYLAFRSITSETVNGIPRLCLNGKPYFFHGLLDQGYYPDGIFTPASPEEFKNDICSMKELGFNMLRKHIKTEPQLFYYYCDLYGMAVFQDFINNGDYSFLRDTALPTIGLKRLPDKLLHRKVETREAFRKTNLEIINTLSSHPSIVYWTIFNEGWGQFSSEAMYSVVKNLDPTRIIDTASGWFYPRTSDVRSEHVYFKKVRQKKSEKPFVLSEFGGYSYKPEGHVANPHDTYGYRFFELQPEFMNALEKLYTEEIIPLVQKGLCATVYTQVSDVEDETNGLLSYDRKVLKVDKERMQKIAKQIYNALK